MAEPGGEIILYQTEDGAPRIEVRLDEQTVWLSLNQMAELFQRDKSTISRHINNVFADGELDGSSVVAFHATTAADGKTYEVAYFNLDVIISVGYRVRSLRGTQFRIWATERLRDYIVKGFAMDDDRLKQLGGGTYWRELLDRIRDIRSSEKVLYRQVLDLYATSVDYDPTADVSRTFFATVQNKLHYAAHGRTAAEVIAERADANKPFMGLLTFAGEEPRAADVTVAKNYLDADELRRLSTLVSAYFDAAEFRALRHEPTYMADWVGHLDRMMTAMDAPILTSAGSVSHAEAERIAKEQLAAYKQRRRDLPTDVERAYLDAVKDAQRKLEGPK